MAKKQSTKSTAQEQTAQRIKRTEAYAEKVRKQFAATANAILDLNKQMPTLDTGVMFSFDAQSNRTRAKVEGLLRQLHSVCVAAIQNGIKLEWEQANTEVDKLISSTFGKEILDNPKFTAWTNRNETAMQAFITRSEKGLNLSDRVWKPVRQLRDEMEVAITVAIGEGQSASQMSRKVREYLNDPDLMFRRFRYKDPETGEWKRKWKKRIKDETTGKNRWIDYDKDDYKTGAGVYKSSAKNAMRVTRTETNIAYRRADNERWQAMDFVLGQRIELSHSHPKTDICDKLQGDYPKTFIFDGWHPQCFCFAVPILADWEEQKKMEDAMIKGEKYVSPNLITDYPQEFKDWVEEHGEQIEAARERGTEPYFIRNNAKVIDNILYPDAKPSIADIAKARHEARTPEKEKMLRDYWQKKVAEGEARRKHQAVLDAAAKRHAERTPEQITAIKQAWNTRKATFHYGQNMLNVMGGISDVDTSALADALKHGNQTAILAEAANLKAIGKQITALVHLDNPLQVAKAYSMADAVAVNTAVEKKLATWAHLSLEQQAKKLKFEAYNYLGGNMNGVQAKFPKTWQLSQNAYIKQLKSVNYKIDIADAQKTLADIKTYAKAHPKAKVMAGLLADAETAIANGESIMNINVKVYDANAEYQKRLKADATRAAKRFAASQPSEMGKLTKTEIDELLKNFNVNTVDEMDKMLRAVTESVWPLLSHDERLILTKYTQTYSYLNEPLRNITYRGGRTNAEFVNDMPILTSALEKFRAPQNMVVRRGTDDYKISELGKRLSEVKKGDVFIDGGFLSTAAHREKGFLRSINMVIVVPKGAQGAFAEPFSHYTDSGKFKYELDKLWTGKTKESVQQEFEWIGQRGCQFRVIKVDGHNIYLELLNQGLTQPK